MSQRSCPQRRATFSLVEYYIERVKVQFYIVNLSKLNPLVKLFIHLWPASLPQREDSPPLSINLLSKMWPASLRPRENVPPLSINSLSKMWPASLRPRENVPPLSINEKMTRFSPSTRKWPASLYEINLLRLIIISKKMLPGWSSEQGNGSCVLFCPAFEYGESRIAVVFLLCNMLYYQD